jgi:Uma2 family endonuclease
MSDMALAYERHRITVDEFHRMADAGIFEPDSRIELIDGELIERMAPLYPPHASTTSRIFAAFVTRLTSRAVNRCQVPITLPDYSEPEPEITIARLEPNEYSKRHPGPADVLLVVEVAESSLDFDRRRKLPVYASSGIPEAWLVNLIDDVVEIYRDPAPDGYRTHSIVSRAQAVTTAAFPDETFAVSDLLPLR